MATVSQSTKPKAELLCSAGDALNDAKTGSPKAPATPKMQLTYDSEHTSLDTWPLSRLCWRNRCLYSWLKLHVSPSSTATTLSPKNSTYEPGGSRPKSDTNGHARPPTYTPLALAMANAAATVTSAVNAVASAAMARKRLMANSAIRRPLKIYAPPSTAAGPTRQGRTLAQCSCRLKRSQDFLGGHKSRNDQPKLFDEQPARRR
ncbi:unnamed protein product [Phytophthora lilii]|uniref:Unnamed protein product n=1 Tax=Phytophthora lilii TaxID=2077276 RepID=A0A9W7CJT2_9STRA|nr:unnamed protein product [Phytophthora lilii]